MAVAIDNRMIDGSRPPPRPPLGFSLPMVSTFSRFIKLL